MLRGINYLLRRLGLYLCKQIINVHGGDITCDSKLGAGATFTVTIPANES